MTVHSQDIASNPAGKTGEISQSFVLDILDNSVGRMFRQDQTEGITM